jgi:hypothetical protein
MDMIEMIIMIIILIYFLIKVINERDEYKKLYERFSDKNYKMLAIIGNNCDGFAQRTSDEDALKELRSFYWEDQEIEF